MLFFHLEQFFLVKYFMELFFPVKYFMELFFSIKCFMELFFFIKYFMELCDEVELVYQRLRVFSGSKKRLPTGWCRGLDFGNAPFGVAGFPSFSAFSHLRKACTPAPCPAGLDIVEPQAANRKRSRFDSYRITPCTAGELVHQVSLGINVKH